MNEVFRRTGNTHLWIKGQHIGEPKDVRIIVELLSREWERIAKLIIWVEAHDLSGTLKEIVQRPAPCLLEYCLDIRGFDQNDMPSPVTIFGGSAPLLTNVAVTSFPIDPRATWLSNIQRLFFSVPFTVVDPLTILQSMTVLYELTVLCRRKRIEGPLNQSTIPLASLPYLTDKVLWMDPGPASSLLPYIPPSPSCSLWIISETSFHNCIWKVLYPPTFSETTHSVHIQVSL